jgi:hypothetical protein
MQAEAWYIHIGYHACRVKPREIIAQLINVLSNHAPPIVLFVKAFQPFVTDRPDRSIP